MMKAPILFLCIYFLAISPGYGQEKNYYNQTEFGAIFGAAESSRFGFSMLTFHGARVAKHHVVGFSAGFDNYETIQVIPIAFGWRGFLGEKDKAQLMGGFDIGGGSTMLEKEVKTEWSESWWEGGLLLSPSVGVYFPGKKQKTAFTLTLAYKRQNIFQFNGSYDRSNPVQFSNSLSAYLPPGFNSLTETSHLFHSLVFRMGLSF